MLFLAVPYINYKIPPHQTTANPIAPRGKAGWEDELCKTGIGCIGSQRRVANRFSAVEKETVPTYRRKSLLQPRAVIFLNIGPCATLCRSEDVQTFPRWNLKGLQPLASAVSLCVHLQLAEVCLWHLLEVSQLQDCEIVHAGKLP